MNSHYIHSEPNQFNNDFHISLISHDNKLSDIMYQLNTSVLSAYLCLVDTLYCFYTFVASTYLFERNFQRNRRGMQLDVRGRGQGKKSTTTIPQIFSFFLFSSHTNYTSKFFYFLFTSLPNYFTNFPIFFSQPIFLKFKNFLRNENYSLQK